MPVSRARVAAAVGLCATVGVTLIAGGAQIAYPGNHVVGILLIITGFAVCFIPLGWWLVASIRERRGRAPDTGIREWGHDGQDVMEPKSEAGPSPPPPKLLAQPEQMPQFRREQSKLQAEGEALAHRYRFKDVKASQEKLDGEYEDLKAWRQQFDDFRALWYSGFRPIDSLLESVAMPFFHSGVPGPEWRSKWVQAIETRLAWLDRNSRPSPDDE